MKLLVLGGGLQGRIAARNLAERDDVTEVVLADVVPPPPAGLPTGVTVKQVDARDADAVRALAEGAAAAVTALPSAIGTVAIPALLDAGVPVVDVSFTETLPFHLDDAAKAAGVPVVVDVGIAPGLSHVLAAALHREMGGADALAILVGGVPVDPPAPFRHAVYFNARDLLAEYLRPARLRRGGRTEAVDPLTAPVEHFEDAEVGPVVAFPTDGLRSLLDSFPDVADMVEMTLRVPGHLEVMRDLKAMGFLDDAHVDATAAVLEERYGADAHPDRLLMEVRGTREDITRAYRVHVLREGDVTAMSRCTAFTTAAVAKLLADGTFKAPGVHAPERLGHDASVTEALLADLAARGVTVAAESRLVPAVGASTGPSET